MPKTFTEVSKDAAALTELERLKLARMLLDLSDPQVEPNEDAQAAWDEEISRRHEELRSGAVEGIPLEDVKARMQGRFRS